MPPQMQPSMPPPIQPPAPVPGGSGSSAVKIILIIVAVFVGLGILGACIFAFTIWRVAHAVHVDSSGENMTLHTPGGSISTRKDKTYSAAELGTDIYPGATNGHGSMKMDTPNESMVTGIFLTSDSKDQVLEFYKSRFGSEASVVDTPSGAILTVNKGEKETVMVTISGEPSQNEGKTQISIVHTKSSKSS